MVRTYGNIPFQTAVTHDEPIGIGTPTCVAERLSSFTGVLKPIQFKYSIEYVYFFKNLL